MAFSSVAIFIIITTQASTPQETHVLSSEKY